MDFALGTVFRSALKGLGRAAKILTGPVGWTIGIGFAVYEISKDPEKFVAQLKMISDPDGLLRKAMVESLTEELEDLGESGNVKIMDSDPIAPVVEFAYRDCADSAWTSYQAGYTCNDTGDQPVWVFLLVDKTRQQMVGPGEAPPSLGRIIREVVSDKKGRTREALQIVGRFALDYSPV